MAVPKRKKSRARRDNRRSHDALVGRNSHECPNCGELKPSHHVCPSCGFYNGRQVFSKPAADTTSTAS